MKAAVIEAKGRLRVREAPEPVMGEFDCLCEILFCATCAGTDLHLIDGHPFFAVRYPTILGHESIGRVVKIGSKVESFKPGDLVTRVYYVGNKGLQSHWGGFAERGLIPDHPAMKKAGLAIGYGEGRHRALPSDIDPVAGTMITTWRETLSFFSRLGFKAGSRVLILGSGANGLAFANHAANGGAAWIVMIGNPARQAAAQRVGVTAFLDYRSENLVETARKGGLDGFDLLIDAVGRSEPLNRAIGLLKNGGVVTIYGVDEVGGVTIDPSRAPATFTRADYGYDEGEAHDRVIARMREGKLRPADYLDEQIFNLDGIVEVFERVRQRKIIKAVIRIGKE